MNTIPKIEDLGISPMPWRVPRSEQYDGFVEAADKSVVKTDWYAECDKETDSINSKHAMLPKLFPTILVILDACAAVPYALAHDWRHTIYWLAAATLTACVTY